MDEIRGNYIKLHRSLLEWEWFQDDKTLVVFLYLLLRANWKPNRWRGIAIDRGQTLETLPGIARATGLSVRSVRTALKHLKSTGEVTDKVTAYGRLINVVNYAKYQDVPLPSDRQTDSETDRQVTGERQKSDRQVTVLKESKERKNSKKERSIVERSAPNPSLSEVESFFDDNGYEASAFAFWQYYEQKEWKDKRGQPLDWEEKAAQWEAREYKKKKDDSSGMVVPMPDWMREWNG